MRGRGFFAALLLIFVGAAGWQVGSMMDTDTTAIIIGFVLGATAAVPVALLLLVADRRRNGDGPRQRNHAGGPYPVPQPYLIMPPQPAPAAPPQPAPQDNRWMVTGGGSFDDMPQPQQDGRFRLNGGGR